MHSNNKFVPVHSHVLAHLFYASLHMPHHNDRNTSDLHVTYPDEWKAASRNTHVLHTVQLLEQFMFTTHTYKNIIYSVSLLILKIFSKRYILLISFMHVPNTIRSGIKNIHTI